MPCDPNGGKRSGQRRVEGHPHCRPDGERQVGVGAGRLPRSSAATIINADSMQVYRDLRIITARPTPDEERRVPHRLYGHVDAAENYSVGRWCADAAAALAAAQRAGTAGDRRRRHRALFQRADARACRRAADPGRDPQRRARAACERRRRRRCMPNSPRAIRPRGAADRRATAPASRARSKWCWRPAVRCSTGTRRTSRATIDLARVAKVFLDAGSRRTAQAASTRASTP